MAHVMKLSALCLFIMLLSSCATTPNQTDLASADYGLPPTNLEETINEYLKETLIDPDSLKNLRIGTYKKGWARTNYGKTILYGYWVMYSYNAKNRYGGYTGQKYYCAFMQGNYIEQVWEADNCKLFMHVLE